MIFRRLRFCEIGLAGLLVGCGAAVLHTPAASFPDGWQRANLDSTVPGSDGLQGMVSGAPLSSSCRLVNPHLPKPLPTSTALVYPRYEGTPSPLPSGLTPNTEMEVFFPPGAPSNPTIVLVHGGGLHLDTDTPLHIAARHLANTLHSVVTYPHYTLNEQTVKTVPPEIAFADQDVLCATRWTREFITRGLTGSAASTIVAGYSAGGQMAATMGSALAAAQVDVAGIAAMSARYDFGIVPCCDDVTPDGWRNLHGTNPNTWSPTRHVISSRVKWFVTYEQCDADTQYGNANLLTAALRRAGDSAVLFEDTTEAPEPCPTHGAGAWALSGRPLGKTHARFVNAFHAFVHWVASGGEPHSTSGVERMPEKLTVRDVAVGGDGSVWIADRLGRVRKYFGREGFANPYGPAPKPASAIAVDGSGEPWIVTSGGISYMPGGEAGAEERGPQYAWSAPFTLPNEASAADIAAGGEFGTHHVWVVDHVGRLYASSQHLAFRTVSGPGEPIHRIGMDAEAHLWATTLSGTYYERLLGGQWLGPYSGDLADVGGASAMFGVSGDGAVYRIIDNGLQRVSGLPASSIPAASPLAFPESLPLVISDGVLYQMH